jgi:hypothetical protein
MNIVARPLDALKADKGAKAFSRARFGHGTLSIMHMLYETNSWLEKYVKNAKP